MDLNYKLYLERANNEIKLADIILILSNSKDIQINIFKIDEPETYYNSVISHSYYCIFYSAKAYLLKKGIKTKAPEEHRKTYEEFKKLVERGIVDEELLKIYDYILVKAETLLGIFKTEKKKRGIFTYRKLPQTNLEPAMGSLENAKTFFKHIRKLSGEI
ncbi:HEPN domain protein [archaeon BMS3Abin17]|nr:HEPN domain protein [archaeon BMS3Abin17]HDZ60955.1 HEPN domain-containing protein [Candidatus Pacearchaeota archaeon]